MKIVLLCLQPPGTKKTLDQLVRECLKRHYAMTFKQVHEGEDLLGFTANSILYHLDRMGSLIGTEATIPIDRPESAIKVSIEAFSNPHPNPQKRMSYMTSANFGSPRGLLSRWKS
jgi:hypothetical protein